MPLDLTDDEKRALAAHLRSVIDADPYPLSPRLRTLRAILDKLAPGSGPEPYPVPKRGEKPSWAMAKKRRR